MTRNEFGRKRREAEMEKRRKKKSQFLRNQSTFVGIELIFRISSNAIARDCDIVTECNQINRWYFPSVLLALYVMAK